MSSTHTWKFSRSTHWIMIGWVISHFKVNILQPFRDYVACLSSEELKCLTVHSPFKFLTVLIQSAYNASSVLE